MGRRYSDSRRKRARQEPVPAPPLPPRLPVADGQQLLEVVVEGYEDVAFWRSIFDEFESEKFTFEITVPVREDLAKGKKVLLAMARDDCPPTRLLCMDSDFDYLFSDLTPDARLINTMPNIFHTYAYATENYVCHAPSLHNVCVKATKNDTRIFDFERFLAEYSAAVYPLFLWYAYSARIDTPKVFTLLDFKSSVKLNYLEVENNGTDTIAWLERQAGRRLKSLSEKYPHLVPEVERFGDTIRRRGVSPTNVYLFMQGHTLMDNVVMVVLNTVCARLRDMALHRISASKRSGVTLVNEQSNYNNSLYSVREALVFNEDYRDCFLYDKLYGDIAAYLDSLASSGNSTE